MKQNKILTPTLFDEFIQKLVTRKLNLTKEGIQDFMNVKITVDELCEISNIWMMYIVSLSLNLSKIPDKTA